MCVCGGGGRVEEQSFEMESSAGDVLLYLRFFDRGAVSVAHRTDVQVLFSLFVTLLEEFLHQKVDPSFVQVQRFGGVTQVRAMYQVLQDLSGENRLVVMFYALVTTSKGRRYLYPVRVVVQQQNARAGYFFRFHHGLQVGQQTHVLGHVGRQHLRYTETRRLIIGTRYTWTVDFIGRKKKTEEEEKTLTRTMSITIFLRVCRCFLLTFWNMSHPSFCKSLKATAK